MIPDQPADVIFSVLFRVDWIESVVPVMVSTKNGLGGAGFGGWCPPIFERVTSRVTESTSICRKLHIRVAFRRSNFGLAFHHSSSDGTANITLAATPRVYSCDKSVPRCARPSPDFPFLRNELLLLLKIYSPQCFGENASPHKAKPPGANLCQQYPSNAERCLSNPAQLSCTLGSQEKQGSRTPCCRACRA